jgi:hypothetical protein
MHGSRNKIPSKNLVWQRCAVGFNSDVTGLMFVLQKSIFTLVWLNRLVIVPTSGLGFVTVVKVLELWVVSSFRLGSFEFCHSYSLSSVMDECVWKVVGD